MDRQFSSGLSLQSEWYAFIPWAKPPGRVQLQVSKYRSCHSAYWKVGEFWFSEAYLTYSFSFGIPHSLICTSFSQIPNVASQLSDNFILNYLESHLSSVVSRTSTKFVHKSHLYAPENGCLSAYVELYAMAIENPTHSELMCLDLAICIKKRPQIAIYIYIYLRLPFKKWPCDAAYFSWRGTYQKVLED